MQIDINGLNALGKAIDYKFWATLAGLGWTAFKGFQWVKEIRTKDLHEVKAALGDVSAKMDTQTDRLVKEFQESREEFRTFTRLFIVPQPLPIARARAPRKPRLKAITEA